MNAPASLAVEPSGSLFVSEFSGRRIQRFDPAVNYAVSAGWDTSPKIGGRLNPPLGIVVAPDGSVWATERDGKLIRRFSRDGQGLGQFGGLGGSAPGGLCEPDAVAVDTGGNVWVGEYCNGRIQKFSPGGQSLEVVSSVTMPDGTSVGLRPRDIALTPTGDIVVADHTNPVYHVLVLTNVTIPPGEPTPSPQPPAAPPTTPTPPVGAPPPAPGAVAQGRRISVPAPDTAGIANPMIVRRGPVVMVAPKRVSGAMLRRGKCVRVRLQTSRPSTITVRIFSGTKSIRLFGQRRVAFALAGKRVVCVPVPFRAHTFDIRNPLRFSLSAKVGVVTRTATGRIQVTR